MGKGGVEMMYVICFYWQGDRWQQPGYKAEEGHVNKQQQFMDRAGLVDDNLPSQYVNNLYEGIKRFAAEPFKFVCFTNEKLDTQEGIEIRPFKMLTNHGVLPRLYMFSKEAGLFGHQVLCLDLDILIVGSLKKIMGFRGEFCTRSKFKLGQGHKLDGDIMSFAANKETEAKFWTPFVNDVDKAIKETEGRERYWIRKVLGEKAVIPRWNQISPGSVLSYKRHIRGRKKIPNTASIISCHGVPRPHQVTNEWIKNFWK